MVTNKKPISVLISDIHYNINTLALADAATRQAISTANELGVTLVVAGDLHDTKANMRGECVNAMIETFKLCERPAAILVGNHCRLNEKAPAHSLNFLAPYAMIVDEPKYLHPIGKLIPYQHDTKDFLREVRATPIGHLIICHQGISGSSSGEYIQDKSAISPDDVAGRRVISGHYHTRQSILLPGNCAWNYIGNPYTLNYAEATDPPKGYQVLYDDGILEFKPTNLRKHVVIDYSRVLKTPEWDLMLTDHCTKLGQDDLVWVKVRGTKESLQSVTKDKVGRLIGKDSFRLDLIPTDTTTEVPDARLNLAQGPLLDSLIDSLSNTSDNRKSRLKSLWKALK